MEINYNKNYKNNKLPQGWVECELKDLCKVISKGTTPKNQTEEPNFARFLKAENVTKESILDLTSCKYIDEETHTKILKRSILKRNDILITIAGTLGRCAIVETDENLNTNQAVCFARLLNCGINPNFIKYFILSPFVNRKLTNKAKVTAIPNLTLEIIKNINIKLPPLNEQKRIVEKIEEEFGKIDEGVEKLKLAQEQIKQYRQSVLKSAFEGKLYKTTEWEEKMFSQVLEVNPKTDIPDIKDDDLISFLPMPAVQAEINIYNEDFVKYSKVKKGYTKFKNRDVLFAKITPCMENGKSCVVDNLKFGIGFGSTEFHILRSLGSILPEFVFYYVVQESFRKRAQNVMTGAVGQRRVPADYLKNISINLPTIDEQKQIVKEIEKRFEVADEVERVITENLDKAEQLKQSILKKAFEGHLVPQYPTDQPASELLAQIQAERKNSHERI